MNNGFLRKLIIWGALAATVLAALLIEDETGSLEDDVVQAVQPASGTSTGRRDAGQARQAGETLPVDRLGKRTFSAKADDIFAVMSWQPKRNISAEADEPVFLPKQEIIRRPPPPSAPPLQFEYLGRVVSEGRTRVFLAQANQNFVAGVGERINDEYRVYRIREDAIELTYLPLGIRQTLPIDYQTYPGKME